MKKILFSYVGEQDPISDKTNEEGSIVTLCRAVRPDIVYLFPTADGPGTLSSTEENAAMTKNWINEEIDSGIKVYVKPLELEDPTDFAELLPATRSKTGKIMACIERDQTEIHINLSSGTPQMKAAWLVLANGGEFPACNLWQVINPKFAKNGERIKKVTTSFLEEENALARLENYCSKNLFEQMSFECLRLKELSCYSHRRQKADILREVFYAYHLWDLIFYSEAYDKLRKVLNIIANAKDLAYLEELLKAQVEVLAVLKKQSEQESLENLTDLYYNARRCFERNNYTDTLARFWRVYEGTLYFYLRQKFGIEPTKLSDSTNLENLRKIKDFFGSKINNELSLSKSQETLEKVFADSKYKRFMSETIHMQRSNSQQPLQLGKTLEEMRGKRNKSIVAHGMRPVNKNDAENCFIIMEKLLHMVFNDNELIQNYPFKHEKILPLIKIIRSTYAY